LQIDRYLSASTVNVYRPELSVIEFRHLFLILTRYFQSHSTLATPFR